MGHTDENGWHAGAEQMVQTDRIKNIKWEPNEAISESNFEPK